MTEPTVTAAGVDCKWCEPTVHSDGSLTHDDECPAYPWCPHEMGAWTCHMPCGCTCAPCTALTEANQLTR